MEDKDIKGNKQIVIDVPEALIGNLDGIVQELVGINSQVGQLMNRQKQLVFTANSAWKAFLLEAVCDDNIAREDITSFIEDGQLQVTFDYKKKQATWSK